MKTHFAGYLAVFILSSIGLFIHYKPYLVEPNRNFFQIYGDGYKNYFSVYYHVKHDSTYSHFQGMNYPYGEHVMYTDGQPGVSNVLKFISRNMVDISNYTVAILNYLMVFSFLITALVLYAIFRKLKLPVWYSVIMATCIMFLTPQHFRTEAHYSLSYSFILPVILYSLMCFEERQSWWLSLRISLFMGFVALLHLYHFAMAGMLIGLYFLFHLLRDFSFKKMITLGFHYGLQVVLPFVLIQVWMMATDPGFSDRPKLPFGFLDYHGVWEGLFTSPKVPVWQWVSSNIIKIRPTHLESEFYIGIAASILLLIFFPLYLIRQQKVKEKLSSPFLQYLFPAIFIILLLAMGLPFTLTGLDWLADYVGPFRQFRGQGRFGWVFFYGWQIMAWFLFYQWWKQRKQVWAKGLLLSLVFGLLFFDTYSIWKASIVHPWQDGRLDRKEFEMRYDYWFRKVDISRYQAVLPAPYYHIGSENFLQDAKGDAVRFSTIPAWHYGLPSMGVLLSRSSFSQAYKLIPLAMTPFQDYQILQDLPSQKPLLVVLDPIQYGASKKLAQYYLNYGKVVYQDPLVTLLELPLDAFGKAVQDWRKEKTQKAEGLALKGYNQQNAWVSDSSYHFVYQSFDQYISPIRYRGKGAFTAGTAKRIPLTEFIAPAANNTCAIWVYVGKDQYPRLNIKAFEIEDDGYPKWIVHNSCKFDLIALDKNGWGLMVFPINVRRPGVRVTMELECKEINRPQVYVDEMLITPTGREADGVVWKNGKAWVVDNFNLQ